MDFAAFLTGWFYPRAGLTAVVAIAISLPLTHWLDNNYITPRLGASSGLWVALTFFGVGLALFVTLLGLSILLIPRRKSNDEHSSPQP